jgi:putative tricarboxylic transport membrane protein
MGRIGLLLVAALLSSKHAAAERLHLIIPAGPGGGLDATARALGNALVATDIESNVSYENRSGGGGGKAMAYFVSSGDTLKNTLLVNSAPLIVRSLQGLFPHSYRDVTPIAALIADPGVIAVREDSKFQSWRDVAGALRDGKERIFVAGGSVRGSLDHIALSLLVQAEGMDPRRVRYLAYDGGAKAQLALLSGEVDVMVSGLGETLAAHRAGTVRILGVTNDREDMDGMASFAEQGVDVEFYNWRGVFAPASVSAEERARLKDQMTALTNTAAWQEQLSRYGWQTMFLSGDEFTAYLAEQETLLTDVMTRLGLIRR